MAKSNGRQQQTTELVKAAAPQVPAYLQQYANEGFGTIREYQSTPRLKVFQDPTDEWEVGDVVTAPDMIPIAKCGEPFEVNLLTAWPSWIKWRDRKDQSDTAVVTETFDKTSDIARCARDLAARTEPYADGKYSYVYAESLNYAIRIEHDGPARDMIAVVSWSRGSYRVGARLSGYLGRLKGTSLWSVRLSLHSDKRSNPRNEVWYQLDYLPAANLFVAENRVEETRTIAEAIAKMYEARTIGVNRDDAIDA